MKTILYFLKSAIKTRLGFVFTLLVIYWFKTVWAYNIDFNLDLGNMGQVLLSLANPVALSLLFLGLGLYVKKTKLFYIVTLTIYALLNILLIANSIYFREFSDFITVNAVFASSKTSAGLGAAALNLLRPWDLIYVADFIVLIFLFVTKRFTFDRRPFNKRASFAVTALSGLLFSINLFLAEIDRPELLTRGFSNVYVVRALGLPAFSLYSANQTYQAQKVRSEATAADLTMVQNYVKKHYAAPNPAHYGIAKGKNVFILHLESFQQFLLDYKLKVDNKDYEVTPFLNSLYHSKDTYAFSNFFHQVKAGKTSDAETLMETSLFGLDQGSFFVQYGGDNTQQAGPHVLSETNGYTSAVFHGNTGTFWNRNNVYKQLGYNYFFDQSYMSKPTKSNSFQYGLNDKVMFSDAIKYLEHMQQPFYTKFITVSNHYPYQSLVGDETGFPLAKTKDETINGYFATANYLDTAIKNFFDYLKATGLYENSIIVLYGDHYGISNSRNTALAELLGKDPQTWTDYNDAMLQRVPYMIHIPGNGKGFISDTYGGEVDALPTLLHILGVDTSKYLYLGQDLLSPNNSQTVAFRTKNEFVTPHYTSYLGRLYDTKTGIEITNPDETTTEKVKAISDAVKEQLKMSDEVQTGDLIRFDKGKTIKPVDLSSISYSDSLAAMKKIEKNLGAKSTSLFSKNGNKSTHDLYKAPSYKELTTPEIPATEETTTTTGQ